MLCTQPFVHLPLPAGFHWLRAVSVMFEVNVAVHIYKWEHVMVFGENDPSRPRIAVWKSDAETHFEPLVPVHCKRWRCRPVPQVTQFPDVSDATALLALRQLTLHPDWSSVQSAAFPPTPPQSPSPAASSPLVIHVSDGEEIVASPSNTRRVSKRLSMRSTKVYADSDDDRSSSTDEHVSESESGPPAHPAPAPCVHKTSGRVRQTARMQCQKSEPDMDTPSSSVSCVHKPSGRARKTARMQCKQSDSSASDDDALLHPPIPLGPHLGVGVMFSAHGYVRDKFPQAKDWLLQAFRSSHGGGHVVCDNSRFDYITAKCTKGCEARAAVTLKQPLSAEIWFVTTVKNGADAACRSSLPPPPPAGPTAPPRPTSPPQDQMACCCCFDDVTQYIACDSGHATCWTCMDTSIALQCQGVDFIRNRGIACPGCTLKADSKWRLPFEDVKHKLSETSVQHVAKADRALIADDAFQAALAANPKRDHVASTLEWLLEPEKCPECETAIEVCDVVSFCVHKRSHGDAARFRMHSNALHQMPMHILLVLPLNISGYKNYQSERRLPQSYLSVCQRTDSQLNMHGLSVVSCQ